jgi:FkbM family methyltransferase
MTRENEQRLANLDSEFTFEFEGNKLVIPFVEMGAITSKHLFGVDEVIIFAFYWANRNRYRRVADLGANIGVHSMVLASLGFQVVAYEPDQFHSSVAAKALASNGIQNVIWREAAVIGDSTAMPTIEFVRVVGNTTSSHVRGAKKMPYGELEYFKVRTESFSKIVEETDLIKMDVEGLEADLLSSLIDRSPASALPDIILEVGTEENAEIIFAASKVLGYNMFSQKTGWSLVSKLGDLPLSYKEGSLFLTPDEEMNWS